MIIFAGSIGCILAFITYKAEGEGKGILGQC